MGLRVEKELKDAANPTKAKILAGYFKTYEGGYGHGDVFLGLTVPVQRKIAKNHVGIDLSSISGLLSSKIHEYRFTALEILVMKFQAAGEKERKGIFDFYIKNTKGINNWDLVDTSAPYIAGEFLLDKEDRKILYKLARSENIWERRIAIVSTYTFIKNRQFDDTLRISEMLLDDKHDLIHKAVGWMLREVGKKDQAVLEKFLAKYCRTMPRTTLRYAIEKFDQKKRALYMARN